MMRVKRRKKMKMRRTALGCRALHWALLTKWRHGPNPLSLSHRHGPRMKGLGLVILTCFFLSLAGLTEKEY